VVLITAYGDIGSAVRGYPRARGLRRKALDNAKLIATGSPYRSSPARIVNSPACASANGRCTNISARNSSRSLGFHRHARVVRSIEKVAQTDANVLILGENGTGKGTRARAIHRHSARCGQAFTVFDMGRGRGVLVRTELFGHRRGAFTERPGRSGRPLRSQAAGVRCSSMRSAT